MGENVSSEAPSLGNLRDPPTDSLGAVAMIDRSRTADREMATGLWEKAGQERAFADRRRPFLRVFRLSGPKGPNE
jgi:hypothetical protein